MLCCVVLCASGLWRQLSSACADSYVSSSCDCFNGDFVKLWYRMTRIEGSGITGAFITLLLYLVWPVACCPPALSFGLTALPSTVGLRGAVAAHALRVPRAGDGLTAATAHCVHSVREIT